MDNGEVKYKIFQIVLNSITYDKGGVMVTKASDFSF